MTYTNATFFLDQEGGSDTARTALTSVTVANNGAGLVRCTKTTHGLVTGAVVDVTLNYAGAWKITVIDANNFDLIGSTYSTSTSVTVTPRGGSSKADAWKTYTSGATAARIAAGDTIRVMGSPDETSIGNATWTNNSKTITLAGAVTANVSTCETAWTASSNVTCSTDATNFKEGTKSVTAAIASGFTTGKAAYFATGTIDLSGYQQISFWFRTDTAIAASTLSLRLCTDTAGATSVHTIAIPAIPSVNIWIPITVNLGSNLNSAIASVALYCDLDPATVTITLDNIIACKDATSADSLSLTSLIGKVWNRCWVASTTYATNDIRKPTQPNRNGFRYKVTAGGGGAAGSSEPTWPIGIGTTVTDGALTWTCEGMEDTYYKIQSINGTTVKLDGYNAINASGTANNYQGATETVATYKRECIKFATMLSASFLSFTDNYVQKAGTLSSPMTYTGGWNRTDMTTQTGETWVTGQNGCGQGIDHNNFSYLVFNNLNGVALDKSIRVPVGSGIVLSITNCHANSCTSGVVGSGSGDPSASLIGRGIVANNNYGIGLDTSGFSSELLAISTNGNGGSSPGSGINCGALRTRANYVQSKGNSANGFSNNTSTPPISIYVANLVTANNASNGFSPGISVGGANLVNAVLSDTTPFATLFTDDYVFSHKHQGVTDSHLVTTTGGSIITATDQRHTASGISWKFRITSLTRVSQFPIRLSLARIFCTANTAINITVWTRRDNTNINGTLKVRGGQIAGIPADVTVACSPTINTWVQSSALTVTPTEDGVIEVVFECYDGVGSTNNFWVDDFDVS